ncbi:MAG TPA: 50S ribosomal protein L6 [Rhabdochlamydiaceae bacterium]
MSKIGRKPIDIGSVNVEIKGQEIHYKGKKVSDVVIVSDALKPQLDGKLLRLTFEKQGKSRNIIRDINRIWGLERALLANKIKGAENDFEKVLLINGLGFKATVAGDKLVLSLGYTHKIDFVLPKGATAEVDKTGQKLVFKSANRELVGQVASEIRMMRPPEPYKGTGVKYESEVITRKAGKAKASAAA